MSDLLSSASLLLTLIALLYGLWYQEIVQAIDTDVPPQPKDFKAPYKRVRGVYWAKANPLLIATIVLTVVFAPESVKILVTSINEARNSGAAAIWEYDAVSTSLLLVNLGSAFFAVHLISLVWKLRQKIRKLRT